MNKFELFCMTFLAIDSVWQETHDETLGIFLSGMSPYTFADVGSADPAEYTEFCQFINEPITEENSYDLACQYVKWRNDEAASKAFATIPREEWEDNLETYLSEEHKGSDAYMERARQAAEDAKRRSATGRLEHEWRGTDSQGAVWHGYTAKDGTICGFYIEKGKQ
ncbi:MAG: hypothetical protein IJT07_02570 [Oscillospiraceae bacterium]|nr:hypothetical protein [Oscillospiraceae bacterium]